jgi:hypothetical protein
MKKLTIMMFVLVFGAIWLGACTPAQAANSRDPLVSIHAEGGLCVYGACGQDTAILQDGSFTVKNGSGEERTGQLDSATLATLRQEIDKADFEAIKAKPFTGTCPIAYDGQEYTFTFYRGDTTEVLDSCKYELDLTSPMFKIDY